MNRKRHTVVERLRKKQEGRHIVPECRPKETDRTRHGLRLIFKQREK